MAAIVGTVINGRSRRRARVFAVSSSVSLSTLIITLRSLSDLVVSCCISFSL